MVRIDLIQVEHLNKIYLLGCRVVSSKGFILFRWLDGGGADKNCVTGVLTCLIFGVCVNVYTATNEEHINELVDFHGVFLVPSQRFLGILFYWHGVYLDPVL